MNINQIELKASKKLLSHNRVIMTHRAPSKADIQPEYLKPGQFNGHITKSYTAGVTYKDKASDLLENLTEEKLDFKLASRIVKADKLAEIENMPAFIPFKYNADKIYYETYEEIMYAYFGIIVPKKGIVKKPIRVNMSYNQKATNLLAELMRGM